jgi:drug/metabolite transporter (DMT)-like permease
VTGGEIVSLLVLAGLWGGSFLFMRAAAPAFGPVGLVELRLVIASLVLLPLLRWRGNLRSVASHWRPLAVVGVLNSAIPFSLLAFATLSVTAGFAAVLNATTPFFAALIARAWLKIPLTRERIAGLVIGFAGVVVLVWGKVSFKDGGSGWAILAGLGASICYAIAASYTKSRLAGVSPLVITGGSLFWGGVALSPFALYAAPHAMPPPRAWQMIAGLGLFSTACAYVLYFRLLSRRGPTTAIAVTFLVPAFAILWGRLFLNEGVAPRMALGAVIVLAGTGLTAGIKLPRRDARGIGPLPATPAKTVD